MDPFTGEGLNRGALYWQLNDVWPGASWSSLEYGGVPIIAMQSINESIINDHSGAWKPSHYLAELSFRDVILSAFTLGDLLRVFAVSDLREDLTDLTLHVEVRKWSAIDEVFYDETVNIGTYYWLHIFVHGHENKYISR